MTRLFRRILRLAVIAIIVVALFDWAGRAWAATPAPAIPCGSVVRWSITPTSWGGTIGLPPTAQADAAAAWAAVSGPAHLAVYRAAAYRGTVRWVFGLPAEDVVDGEVWHQSGWLEIDHSASSPQGDPALRAEMLDDVLVALGVPAQASPAGLLTPAAKAAIAQTCAQEASAAAAKAKAPARSQPAGRGVPAARPGSPAGPGGGQPSGHAVGEAVAAVALAGIILFWLSPGRPWRRGKRPAGTPGGPGGPS